MPLSPETREAFRSLLIANDLQPEAADAILESMVPHDWSELVRRSDLARVDDHLHRFEDRVDQRFDRIDERFDRIDERFERVDQRFERIDERFERVDQRFDRVDQRFERVDERFEHMATAMATMNDSLNGRIDGLYNVMLRGFVTTIAMLVIGFASLLGVGLAG